MAENIERWTRQMTTILDIVNASDVHLTADEIFLESKKVLPKISLGTVYRNLNRLSAQGMISIVPKGPVNTFCKHSDDNAHFECDRCHRLFCVPFADFGVNASDLSRKSGFRINKCSLNLSGICRECLRKGSDEGRDKKSSGSAQTDNKKSLPARQRPLALYRPVEASPKEQAEREPPGTSLS